MRWSHMAITQMPKCIIGVYAFWRHDNGKCIYVGKGKDDPIRERLLAHWRGSHNEELKHWIRAFGAHLDVCYMAVQYDRIDDLERRLIKALKPETNIQHNR